jgi:hypothetical protein
MISGCELPQRFTDRHEESTSLLGIKFDEKQQIGLFRSGVSQGQIIQSTREIIRTFSELTSGIQHEQT